jgi:putative membrane protein
MSSLNQFDAATVILLILGVLIVLPLLTMGMAFGGMMGGGMMGSYGGYGISPLWGLGMLLVWVIVLGGGAYLAYRLMSQNPRGGTDQALEELRVEYARGNVSEEEYEQRRDRLRQE